MSWNCTVCRPRTTTTRIESRPLLQVSTWFAVVANRNARTSIFGSRQRGSRGSSRRWRPTGVVRLTGSAGRWRSGRAARAYCALVSGALRQGRGPGRRGARYRGATPGFGELGLVDETQAARGLEGLQIEGPHFQPTIDV